MTPHLCLCRRLPSRPLRRPAPRPMPRPRRPGSARPTTASGSARSSASSPCSWWPRTWARSCRPRSSTDHPVALLALSARNRHLLLAVAAGIGAVPYTLVSFARLAHPRRRLLPAGQVVRRPGSALAGSPGRRHARPAIRWVERGFDRAAVPIVFLMPGSNLVCLLAGARQMTTRDVTPWCSPAASSPGWPSSGSSARPSRSRSRRGARLADPRYQWWIAGAFLLLTMAQSFRRASVAVKQLPSNPDPAHCGRGAGRAMRVSVAP